MPGRPPLTIFWHDGIGEYCCEAGASTLLSDVCRKLKMFGYPDGQAVQVIDAVTDEPVLVPLEDGQGTVRTIGQGIHQRNDTPNSPHPTYGHAGGWLGN